jgi:PKD repeat protein
VADIAGNKGTATQTVIATKTDVPPTPKLTLGADPNNDLHIYYDTSDSLDIDGKVTARELDFGDGSSTRREFGSHVYKKAGTYKLQLSVTDDGHRTARITRTIKIVRMEQLTIRITKTSQVWGKVDVSYSGDSCAEQTCKYDPPRGSRVNLKELLADASTWPFKVWTLNGRTISSTPTLTFNMSGASVVTANYASG